MITLLRKIRRSLIESGSMRKYFFYAIGEIALVVIGILIALQINNLNEKNKTQGQINLQLENLKTAIELDLKTYESVLITEGFRYNAIDYLLKMAGEKVTKYDNYNYDKYPTKWDNIWKDPIPENYDRAFIDVSFTMIDHATLGSIINNMAMQEFTNSGLYSELSDVQLKNQINEYYRSTNIFFAGNSWEYNIELTLKTRELLENNYQIDARRISAIEDPIKIIEENKLIKIKLHTLLDKISWNCEVIIKAQGMAQKVIKDIDEKLRKM